MLMVTVVVCVVAINAWIYLKPAFKKNVAAIIDPAKFDNPFSLNTPPEQTPTPSPTLSPSSSPSPPVSPSPTPTPVRVYQISGQVVVDSQPIGGVNVVLGGTMTASTTTSANGNYTFRGLHAGGSYTITPSNTRVSFTPGNRSLDRLSKDESADFSGFEVLRISGRVMDARQPLVGVKIKLEGSRLTSTTTDANGNYTFSDLRAGGSYTITPVREKVNFTPSRRSFNNLKQDGSADFNGLDQPHFYKIWGRVMGSGRPHAGVKIKLEGAKLTSTTTDGNGNYTFSDLRAGGSYTVTPVSGKINFTPNSRSFNNLTQDESANFVGPIEREVTLTPTPPPECSATDKERIGASLIGRFGDVWRRNIGRERSRIIVEALNMDVKNADATLGPIEFQPTLTTCSAALITARYAWQVKADLPQGLKVVNVPRVKRFTCGKVLNTWLCN